MPGERRNIFVYGTRDNASQNKVWLDIDYGTGYQPLSEAELKHQNNAYLKDNKYTVCLSTQLLSNVYAGAIYNCKIYLGDSAYNSIFNPKEIKLKVIANRDFNIKYSYQASCDLFDNNVSLQFTTRVDTAFNGSNTKVNFTYEGYNLSSSIIQYENDGLFLYVYNNISTEFQGISRLISAYDIQIKNNAGNIVLPDTSIVGMTQMTRHVDAITQKIVFDHGESFTFHHRATLYHSGDELKKDITRAAIHEIGHLRGRETELLHTTGHNGKNDSCCVMYLPDSVSNNIYLKILNKPIFCECHNQILFDKKE